MVQVLEKKNQNEASRFYLGKHGPESRPQKTRSCVLVRTSCYFSRCQVNVCSQEEFQRRACLSPGRSTPDRGGVARSRSARPRSSGWRPLSSAFPKSPPRHRLLPHLHTRGLSLLCLPWSKCPCLLRRPAVCVRVHPVASFGRSSLLRDVDSRYSHTAIRRLQHMNGGTEQINDKPQEERPGPQEGAGGGGGLPFLVQRLCPVLWREGDRRAPRWAG